MLKRFEPTGKKVLVMGLGYAGLPAAVWLLKHGAQVTVTDSRTAGELHAELKQLHEVGVPFETALGGHRLEDFQSADVVVKGPGIPYDNQFVRAAVEAKVPIESDVTIFARNFPGTVVGVTGTKGKTTTTTLISEVVRATGKPMLLGGNLRKSPLAELDAATKEHIAVLELSSFQLEDLAQVPWSPHVAVWTNLFPDHLNRYGSLESYAAAKANIFAPARERHVCRQRRPAAARRARQALAGPGALVFYCQAGYSRGIFARQGAGRRRPSGGAGRRRGRASQAPRRTQPRQRPGRRSRRPRARHSSSSHCGSCRNLCWRG
ncbi:MAG: Mur ligase family protein [Candidatus Andersenbacteria bacterium]